MANINWNERIGTKDGTNKKYPELDLSGAPYSLPADTCGVGGDKFVVMPRGMKAETRDYLLEQAKLFAAPADSTEPQSVVLPRPASVEAEQRTAQIKTGRKTEGE